MASLKQIAQDIHRRLLWQIFGFYVVIAVVVLEVSNTIAERRMLPEWFALFALVLLIVGLPVVLITAALQEGIPRLGRSDPNLELELGDDSEKLKVKTTGIYGIFTWRNAIMGGVAAFTLWAIVAVGWLVLADQFVSQIRKGPDSAVEGEP